LAKEGGERVRQLRMMREDLKKGKNRKEILLQLLQENLTIMDFERAGLPNVLAKLIKEEVHVTLSTDLKRKYYKAKSKEEVIKTDSVKVATMTVSITEDKNHFRFMMKKESKEIGKMDLHHSCTIRRVKKECWRICHTPVEDQNITKGEQMLLDQSTLAECGLLPNDVLILWRKRKIINFATQAASTSFI